MRRYSIILLVIIVTVLSVPLFVSGPVVADHATCTDEEPGYCQSTMDWEYIFQNTEIVTGIGEDSNSQALSEPNRQKSRNLYQGIWDSRAQPNNELLVGSFTDDPEVLKNTLFRGYEYSEHWVDGEVTTENAQNNEPQYISTRIYPDWWDIASRSAFRYTGSDSNEEGLGLADNQRSASVSSWNSEGDVREIAWDYGSWEYTGDFEPTAVSLDASVPRDTNLTVEIYEPVEPSVLEEAESNGNLDSYKLGEAEFGSSGLGSGSISQLSSSIRHGDGELGLSETYPPTPKSEFDEISGAGTIPIIGVSIPGTDSSVSNIVTYHVRVEMQKNSIVTETFTRADDSENDNINGFEENETVRLPETPIDSIRSATDGSGNSVDVEIEDAENGLITVQDSGFGTLEVEYEYTTGTPAVGLDSPVRLGKPIPAYRRGSDAWMGYPSVLPSVDRNSEPGELYNLTYLGNDNDQFNMGYTESMAVNFGSDYLHGSQSSETRLSYGTYSETSSYAPRIPQDRDPSDDDQPIGTDRFYHGAVSGEDYHLLSEGNLGAEGVDNPQIVFHHAYTETPRVEMSTYWQEDYSSINPNEWKTIASEDGVMYSIMDVATNEINYTNSNIKYYDHETENTTRKYNGLTGSDGIGASGLPDYTKQDYDEDDLVIPAVRMDYEIDSVEIKPEVGADYEYTRQLPDGLRTAGTGDVDITLPFRNDLTDESFRKPESFVFDYNQSIIQDGKQELTTDPEVTDAVGAGVRFDDFEFVGFYSLIEDVRVTYNIDYEVYSFDSRTCPDHPGFGVDVQRDNGTVVDVDPLVGSAAVDSTYDNYAGIYEDYDDYISGDSDYGSEYGIDYATGKAECSVSGPTDDPEEYIREGSWQDVNYDYENPDDGELSNWVLHDDGGNVTYNASDDNIATMVGSTTDSDDDGGLFGTVRDIISGNGNDESVRIDLNESLGPADLTKDEFHVDKFGFERADEQGPSDGDISDAFSVDTAIGQRDFNTRTRFERDLSEGLENTRWTRAESTATLQRQTILLDQLGGTENISQPVPTKSRVTTRYNELTDLTSETPLDGEITEDMDVYIDIYHYGPSQTETEVFELQVENNTVYQSDDLPSSYSGYDSYTLLESVNITDTVVGEEEIDMEFDYNIPEDQYDEETANDIRSDAQQRFDYVLKIDTNHPIQHINSRWGYNTFRDSRFDVTYEFNSSDCVIDSDTNCYDYQSHSIPSNNLSGEQNYPDDPSDGNPVETIYPSNTMFVHPYLMPTTNSLEISDPLGLDTEIRPTQNLTSLLNNNEISYQNRFDESGVNVESEGNFIFVEDQTTIEPVREDKPETSRQQYVSINFHDWYPKSRSNAGSVDEFEPMNQLPEHRSLSDFPAMMKYGESEMDRNYEAPNGVDMGVDGEDVEVHDIRFRDGRVVMNATVHNPDVLPLNITTRFVVLDLPRSTVSNWPNQGSIPDDVYTDGILFGGYEDQDFDNITRGDLSSQNQQVFENSDGILSGIGTGDSVPVTYNAQSQTWLAGADEVRSELQGSDYSVRLNTVDYSPLNSPYCPYNPNNEQRYCGQDKINTANFNIEYAFRDEVQMSEHLNPYRPPIDNNRNKSAFTEYGSFELVSEGDSLSEWNIAGDASWETRSIDDTSSRKMFDAANIFVEPVNVSEETQELYESTTAVDHEFVDESEAERENIQQYKLRIEDGQGEPIGFADRVRNYFSGVRSPVSEYEREVNGLTSPDRSEGVCIDVDQGGTRNVSGSYYNDCYLTGGNGELYFTVHVDEDSDITADNADLNVSVVGSEENWWRYPDGWRLIESSSASFTAEDVSIESEDSSATLPVSILSILAILLIFTFVLSMVLRIRVNPSGGPSTRDLINLFYDPFVRDGVKRLLRIVIYLVLLSIGSAVFVSATTEADISFFFVLEGIFEGLVEALFAD